MLANALVAAVFLGFVFIRFHKVNRRKPLVVLREVVCFALLGGFLVLVVA